MGLFDNISKTLANRTNTFGTALRASRDGGVDAFSLALDRAKKEEEENRRRSLALSLKRTGDYNTRELNKFKNITGGDDKNSFIFGNLLRDKGADRAYEFAGKKARKQVEREDAGLGSSGGMSAVDKLFSGKRFAQEIAFGFGGKGASDKVKGFYDYTKDKGPGIGDFQLGDIPAVALDEATAPGNILAAFIGGAVGPATKGMPLAQRLARAAIEPVGGPTRSFTRRLIGETAIGAGARGGASLTNQALPENIPQAARIPLVIAGAILAGGGVEGTLFKPQRILDDAAENAIRNYDPMNQRILYSGQAVDVDKVSTDIWLTEDFQNAKKYAEVAARSRGADPDKARVYAFIADNKAIAQVDPESSVQAARFFSAKPTDVNGVRLIGRVDDPAVLNGVSRALVKGIEPPKRLSGPRDASGRFTTPEVKQSISSGQDKSLSFASRNEPEFAPPRGAIDSPVRGSSPTSIDEAMGAKGVPELSRMDPRERAAFEERGYGEYRESIAPGAPDNNPVRGSEQLAVERQLQGTNVPSVEDARKANIKAGEVPGAQPPQFQAKTLRDHLNELIWGDPELDTSTPKAFDLAEKQRSQQLGKLTGFERPELGTGDYRLRAEELINSLSDDVLDAPVPLGRESELISSLLGAQQTDIITATKSQSVADYRKAAFEAEKASRVQYIPTPAPGRYSPLREPSEGTIIRDKNLSDIDSPIARAVVEGDPDPIPMDTVTGNDVLVRADDPDFPPPDDSRTLTAANSDDPRSLEHYHDSTTIRDIGPLTDNYESIRVYPKGVRKLLGKWINPSAAMDNPVQRAFVAYKWQQMKAKQLIGIMLAKSIDNYDSQGIGRALTGREQFGQALGTVFHIDENGKIVGANHGWGDMFEDYWAAFKSGDITPAVAKYNLNKKQTDFIERYMGVFEELNDLARHYGVNKVEFITKIPRSIDEINEIRIHSKANITMERVYDTMADGIANGVSYNNPRETLKAFSIGVYANIVDKQYADEMMKLGVSPNDVINPKIHENLVNATIKMDDLRLKKADIENQIKATPDNASLKVMLKDINAQIKSQRQVKKLAKQAYTDARIELLSDESIPTAKGSLFGSKKENIEVKPWKNHYMQDKRFFTYEDYEFLRDYVGINGIKPKEREVGKLSKIMQDAASLFRLIASGSDAGLPLIQGLPIFATDQRAFGSLMYYHYKAFFDLQQVNKLVADNYDDVVEMVRVGMVPIDTELFEAAEQGGVLRKGFDLLRYADKPLSVETGSIKPSIRGATGTGFKHSMGRFQSAYNSGLLAGRIRMWQHGKASFVEDMPSLGRLIRNASSGLDADLLAVSNNQRARESLWLAFSPRMTRSAVGLMAQATELGTPAGRRAALALVMMGTFMAGTAYTAGKYLFDMNDEELKDMMNPGSGKKFLSVKTSAGWIGYGGVYRSIAQFLYNVGKSSKDGDWKAFQSADQFENPILRFYSSRGAPGLSFGALAIEGLTGANADPYNDVNGKVDMLKLMGKNFTPFWWRGIIEGDHIAISLAEFQGGRASGFTEGEKRNRDITAMFPEKAEELGKELTLDDLNKEQRKEYFDKRPFERDPENDNISRYFSDLSTIEQKFNDDVAYQESMVQSGVLSRSDFREWLLSRKAQKYDEINQVKDSYETIPAERGDFVGSVVGYLDSRNTQPEDKAVQDWYNLIEKNTKRDGSIDFDALDVSRTKFLESLSPGIRDYVVRNTLKKPSFSENGIVEEYERAQEITRPYWEAEEEMFNQLRTSLPFLSEFETVESLNKEIEKMAAKSGVDVPSMEALLEKAIPDFKIFNELTSDYKRFMRISNPELDLALQLWYDVPAANRLGSVLAKFGYTDRNNVTGQALLAGADQPSRAEAAALGLSLASSSDRKPYERRYFSRPRLSLTK